jgi:hypothetical protein
MPYSSYHIFTYVPGLPSHCISSSGLHLTCTSQKILVSFTL